jgi:hypothetical protein
MILITKQFNLNVEITLEILMTDGDRLIYERKPHDWYQDMYHMREDDPPT